MKLIKLNRRYSLYEKGFVWAFRGTSSDRDRSKIEQYLTRVYGHHGYRSNGAWISCFGNARSRLYDADLNLYYSGRPYYIALCNEADATACALVAGV